MKHFSIKHGWIILLGAVILFTSGTAMGSPQAAQPAEMAVTLGETGVSFAYARTLGHTGDPYPPGADYLYGPNGLLIDDDDNLYVVEQAGGQRMLQYDFNFLNTLTIGHAGIAGVGGG